jgi:hypothetical protein
MQRRHWLDPHRHRIAQQPFRQSPHRLIDVCELIDSHATAMSTHATDAAASIVAPYAAVAAADPLVHIYTQNIQSLLPGECEGGVGTVQCVICSGSCAEDLGFESTCSPPSLL